EPVRWEAFRLEVGHSYDLRNDRAGDVFGTVIVRPTDRLRFRGDIIQSVHGEGVQSGTSDVAVRVADFLTFSIGQRFSEPNRFNFITTGLNLELSKYVILRNTNNFDVRSGNMVESRTAADIKFQCWSLTVEFVHRQGRDDELN